METTKQRSPSYPAIDLETAVTKVGAIQSSYRRASVDREALAKCIGYSSLSGAAFQVLASLNSYGLIERRGKGEAAVTELAMQYLFAESAAERAEAARRAAMTPKVFNQIAEKFESHVPHNDGIVLFLRRIEFTEKAAKIAAKTYIRTIQYVESLTDSDRSDSGTEIVQNLQQSVTESVATGKGEEAAMHQQNAGGEYRDFVRGSVTGGNSFRLLGKCEFNAVQLRDIIDMLTVQVKIAERRVEVDLSHDAPAAG